MTENQNEKYDTGMVHEFRCPDCGRRVTRGPSGVEYGHERGAGETGMKERCPRRPVSVDPNKHRPSHDGWCLPGGETVPTRPGGAV